jgi:predicted Zn-dependent protease
MTDSAFYKLGRVAASKTRKVKWMWNSLTGDESEAISAEYGVGREMAAVVREQSGESADPALRQLLDQVTLQLASVVRNKLHRFEADLVYDQSPTAYALPGGFVFITQSLTELCQRDQDEVAFVIAHEMAHVVRKHAIKRVLRQTAYSAASMLVPGRGTVAPWLRQVGVHWLEHAYSHEQEYEADALGCLLMRSAGFDTQGATRLLHRLLDLYQGTPAPRLGVYFSTHPPVQDRIARLQRRLRETKPKVKRS